MTAGTILLFTAPILLALGFFINRKGILANRFARVGSAVLLTPLMLFCAFGFLASYEGTDTSFIAFRVFYAQMTLALAGSALVLVFGKLKSNPDSTSP